MSAHTAVKAEEGVITDDVRKGGEHAFGAIGSASLKADLLKVSAWFLAWRKRH